MKKCKRLISLTLAVLLLAALAAGCGKKEAPFQVVFASPFVNEELAASFGEGLTLSSETPVLYSGFSFGSNDVDPMAYAAGAMMMTAMLTAGELDVLVCDLEDVARYARDGAFYDLTEIFTEEELAEDLDHLLTFEIVDEYGVPTGERTAPCGLDISGTEAMDYILGGGQYGIFIFAGTEDLETAREVFWKIVHFR